MATYFIGLINFFLGNSKESIQSFEQMKKKSGESNISNYFLAQLKLSNNEFKESISLLEELLDITPNFAELYYLLGNAYYKLHDNFKAIQYFNKALELNPQDNRSKEMLELFSI
jgi:tetratricopeptide (TPR) repeat protein